MTRILRDAFQAFTSSQQARANARLMRQLDERTLRDIGLHAEANARRERVRRAQAFTGLF